jgi:hypothetical protein
MPSKLIPTVFLSGGLGNQLFQIAAGLRLASKFVVINTSQIGHSTELESFIRFVERKRDIRIAIDSTRPNIAFQKAHNYLLRSKTWRNDSEILNVLIRESIKAIFCLSGVKPRKVIIEESELNNPKSNLQKEQEIFVIGYFQQESIASEIRNDLNEFLDMSFDTQSYTDLSPSRHQLMVHIRKGDYATESGIGMLSTHYFLQALVEVRKMHEISTINLFTNGKIDFIELRNISEFGNLVQSNSDSAFELLTMMRQCGNFLISNSTLSWWAAYLSTNSEKQVFAPIPWFRTLPEPVNLIPMGWIRLPAIWSQGNET